MRITHTSWNDGWDGDEWNEVLRNGVMTGVPLDGTKVGNKRMTLPQAHFRKDVWTSSLTRFEWVKMNLDTGAAVNTCPLNFGPKGAGDGKSIELPVVNGSQMVELGNSKDTMRTDCPDL